MMISEGQLTHEPTFKIPRLTSASGHEQPLVLRVLVAFVGTFIADQY